MTDYFQTDLSFLNIPAEVAPVPIQKCRNNGAKHKFVRSQSWNANVKKAQQSAAYKKAFSDAARKAWQNPARLIKATKAQQKLWLDIEYRQKIIRATKQMWADKKKRKILTTKMRLAAKKRVLNTDWLKKVSLAQKKRWADKTKREALIAALRSGHAKYRKTKRYKIDNIKRANKRRGRPAYVCTDETRLKMSIAARNRKRTPRSLEARKRMSAAQRKSWAAGKRSRKLSAEHRAKISAGGKRRYAKLKQGKR